MRFIILLLVTTFAAQAAEGFAGKKSDFHSFDRYEFQHHDRKCYLVTPRQTAPGKPWAWRARFFGHQPQTDIALLKQGWHVAYIDVSAMFGAPQAVAIWDDFYQLLTKKHGFDPRPALIGMSRGGLIIFNWAKANPDKLSCIYADAPVCDFKSWPAGKGTGKGHKGTWEQCLKVYGLTDAEAAAAKVNPIDGLEPLATAKIPLLHVVGDADQVVPVEENTGVLEKRYLALGGPIEVIHKPGVGHHPHSLNPPTRIVDFILKARN
ncbi:MAG: alpha/beta hydrolase family protein [Verrucomicrobiia bacterium]|jgi:pimeloyl-ACP methyl ester carboxylesterase